MALRLSELNKATKTITIFKGEDNEFNVTYRLDFYTANVEVLIAELGNKENNTPLASNVKIVEDIIVDWDLVDDDNNPIKPTAEILENMGSKVISAILTGIMTESTPDPKTSSTPVD